MGPTVPAALADPGGVVAGFLQARLGKGVLLGLQFLQADHVRSGGLQPGKQGGQARVDANYVEHGDPHAIRLSLLGPARLPISGNGGPSDA